MVGGKNLVTFPSLPLHSLPRRAKDLSAPISSGRRTDVSELGYVVEARRLREVNLGREEGDGRKPGAPF